MIDNGRRARLIIAGVCDGVCGVLGNKLAFRRNRTGKVPEMVKGGLLDDVPVFLTITKDEIGPFYTARFEAFQ